jgi:hypothetical protein
VLNREANFLVLVDVVVHPDDAADGPRRCETLIVQKSEIKHVVPVTDEVTRPRR